MGGGGGIKGSAGGHSDGVAAVVVSDTSCACIVDYIMCQHTCE